MEMSSPGNPVILTYHSVSAARTPLHVSPALFAQQAEWLAGNVRVARLAEVVEALRERKRLPQRTVVLTFDDGFENFYTAAAPVLRRFRFPATVFLPTAFCGKTNAWPGQPSWVPAEPLLNWEQVRELAEEGFAFGAHSHTHPVLTEVSPAEAEREIEQSRREVEAATGRAAEFFCYPYGQLNPSVRTLVQKHFVGACSTAAGILEPRADPFALPRVDVHYLRSAARFRSLFTRRLQVYVAARRLVRRVRGQPEGYYLRA